MVDTVTGNLWALGTSFFLKEKMRTFQTLHRRVGSWQQALHLKCLWHTLLHLYHAFALGTYTQTVEKTLYINK